MKKIEANPGFKTLRDRYLNVLLFYGDLLIIQNKQSALLESVFNLHEICKQYNMKITHYKNKSNHVLSQGTSKRKNNNQII